MPKILPDIKVKQKLRQQKVKEYYDKSAPRKTPVFQKGQPVFVQKGKVWEEATILGTHIAPWSHIIEDISGNILRRNNKYPRSSLHKSQQGDMSVHHKNYANYCSKDSAAGISKCYQNRKRETEQQLSENTSDIEECNSPDFKGFNNSMCPGNIASNHRGEVMTAPENNCSSRTGRRIVKPS
ncbi:hypothetical protein PR048_013687 [Dryococelus australis]|uniref:Uncharacterized protein n=1 Tax=Dryococelus australis TaxID=614101 RepID=A0ABQ9HSX5_9NEOP|nr:hypothetical protein PR048_013687 [Dryococelus australis]